MKDEVAAAEVTQLLEQWRGGDREAGEILIPLVYNELHALASRYLSNERPNHTLQSTALVNEAYLRLAGQGSAWQNRAHFIGMAAKLMRRILVDHARRLCSAKRGAGAPALSLEDVGTVAATSALDPADTFALDRALEKLEAVDAQQGRVVELRFYGGLTFEEAAEVMGLSQSAVKREWAMAKAWLYRELEGLRGRTE